MSLVSARTLTASPATSQNAAAKRLGRAAWRLGLLALVVGALLLAWGARKVPTGPASGTALHAVGRPEVASLASHHSGSGAPAPAPTFRVGTFNIDGARGLDGRVDLHRTAAQMTGCDLLGLNEVHGRTFGEHRDQAERLWPISAERPIVGKVGPLKAFLRRLMRWYVEPAFADQRAFNDAVLKLIDDLDERIQRLEQR